MKLDAEWSEWLEWLGGYVREQSGLEKKTIIDWLRSKNTLIKSILASKITWAMPSIINHEEVNLDLCKQYTTLFYDTVKSLAAADCSACIPSFHLCTIIKPSAST